MIYGGIAVVDAGTSAGLFIAREYPVVAEGVVATVAEGVVAVVPDAAATAFVKRFLTSRNEQARKSSVETDETPSIVIL